MIAWLIARPKILAGLILVVLALGWHFQDKLSDLFDGWKIARLEKENAALLARVSALEDSDRKQEAAIQAATAARNRNDERIPAIRSASAGRVERASTADAAVSLQDDTAALGGYSAAAGGVRGKSAR